MNEHTLDPDTITQLENHDAVKYVGDAGFSATSVSIPWKSDTETIRELVEIAGRPATVYGGDTRIALVWTNE